MPSERDMPTVYVKRNEDGTYRVWCDGCDFDDSINISHKIAKWTGYNHLEWHAVDLGLA